MFPDTGFSVQARVLSFVEGGSLYNALNFAYEYNDASGGNFTGASPALSIYICPFNPAQRDPRHRPERPERFARTRRPRPPATVTWTMPRRSIPTSTW